MFAKLLKYEWRANGGLLGLLTLGVLGVGVLATGVLCILSNYGDAMAESESLLSLLTYISMNSFLFFAFLSLVIYGVAVQLVLLYRFYKHKFTDEGYLTFTLPATPVQIFWSSLLNMVIWMLISGAAVTAAVTLALTVGVGTDSEFFRVLGTILDTWRELLREALYVEPDAWTAMVVQGLQIPLNLLNGLVLPMTCITVGAVLAKKHKLLTAVGIYYGVNMGLGIFRSALSLLSSSVFFFSGITNEAGYMLFVSLLQLLLTAGILVGGYFLTIHLMKNKLNLP